jgi:hypothetical protein
LKAGKLELAAAGLGVEVVGKLDTADNQELAGDEG